MTTPDANAGSTAAASSKSLAWVALAIVVIAALLNLVIMSRGGHVALHAWGLLVGLAISLPAYFTPNRGNQRLFIGVAMIIVLASLYGIFTKAF